MQEIVSTYRLQRDSGPFSLNLYDFLSTFFTFVFTVFTDTPGSSQSGANQGFGLANQYKQLLYKVFYKQLHYGLDWFDLCHPQERSIFYNHIGLLTIMTENGKKNCRR